MSFTVNNLLSYIFPFAESEIYFDLKPSLVCRILSNKLSMGEIELREGFRGWSKKRFTGSFVNNVFELTGPFGHKEWTLITRGMIEGRGAGTVINLSFRLINVQLFSVFGLMIFYFYMGYYYVGFGEMWPILAAQVLFLYSVMIFVFHYQISRIKNWLKEWVYE
jgi:hypothetical protein